MNLVMSAKERDRLVVIEAVNAQRLTQRQAAEQLGISARQVRRSLQRFRAQGDAGLLHRSRGQPSNRRVPPAVEQQAREALHAHYRDFGPTLAAQQLQERHGIVVSKETVRRWMVAGGLYQPKPRKLRPHTQRPRRECRGELVQIDGSKHAWLEGRGATEPDLISAIDDATGRVFLQFVPAESTAAIMTVLRDYLQLHGRPLALYADLSSIYRTTRAASVEEQLQGRESETQVARALRELGIEYIPAYSPQAKGRVERCFGTLQDRLVKELRLEGISDIESANRFLREHFIDDFNERFAVEPACAYDAHRPAEGFDLDAILSEQELRTVTNDFTIRFRNVRYQIARESMVTGLRGGKVLVEVRLDGSVHARFRDRYLSLTELPPPPPKTRAAAAQPKPRREPTAVTPAADHPWRRDYRTMPDGPTYP